MSAPRTIAAAMRLALSERRADVASAIELFEQWSGELTCVPERRCLAANVGFGMSPNAAARRRYQYRLALRLCPDRSLWRRSNRNPSTLIGL